MVYFFIPTSPSTGTLLYYHSHQNPSIPFRTLLKIDSVTNRHTWSSPVRIGVFLTFKASVQGSKPKQLTIFTIGFVLNLAAHCRE